MNTTTASGSRLRISSRQSKPSCPLLMSRWKFMSSRMTSGWNDSMKGRILSGLVATFTFST